MFGERGVDSRELAGSLKLKGSEWELGSFSTSE